MELLLENNHSNIYFREQHQAGYDLLQLSEMFWWLAGVRNQVYQSQSFGFPTIQYYLTQS